MSSRLRFAIGLSLVALGAALFAIAFRASLGLLYRLVYQASNVVEAMASLPLWLRLLVPTAGALTAGLISKLFGARSQGVSNVMEAVVLGNVQLSLRATWIRVACSWNALAAGMSIGREGPLIEFGGSLGAAVGRTLGAPLTHTRVLVAAGTAAGFAAAYNTPFAAVLFVFETIVGVAALEALLPTMAAVLIATTFTRAVVGGGPIYGQRGFVAESAWDLISFAILGFLATFAAFGFKRILAVLEQFLDDYPIPQPLRAALGGLVVGVIAMWIPNVAGNGYEPLNGILDQELSVPLVSALLLTKVLATSASVASGVPGGIFTPVLLVGGALGSLWAHLLVSLGVSSLAAVGSYALVGMAAAAAASIHAPLTAAVLVFELSGDYPIALPLLLSTVLATSVSRALGSESVYEAELRRKGLRWELTLEGRRVLK